MVKKEGEDEDENIVAKVETKDDNMIAFDEDKKKKGRKSDPYELPKSMIERYGSEIKLSKKEQKRLEQNKHAKPVIIDDLEQAASTAQLKK